MYGNATLLDQLEEQINQAIDLEVYPVLVSQGSSGSYFCRNKDHEIIGIFKPKDEEPYSSNNPKWIKFLHRTFLWCCFGREGIILNMGYLSEAGASLLDSRLELGIVPCTRVMHLASPSFHYKHVPTPTHLGNNKWNFHLPPKAGSFQFFVNNFVSANVFLKRYPLPPVATILDRLENGTPCHDIWTPHVLEQFLLQFQKMVALDYVIRNTDRGTDNWLIQYNDKDIFIAAIDNGLAFPYKHPDFIRSYPYGWSFLDLARIPFLTSLKTSLLQILDRDVWWRDTKDALHHLFSLDDEFDDDMFDEQMALLRGQLWNLYACLRSHHQSPADLIKKPSIMVWSDFVETDEDRSSRHSIKDKLLHKTHHIKTTIVQKIRRIETVGQAYLSHW